jgi:hypothetical protein
MNANSQITRQGWACGFEPPAPRHVPVVPWQPPMNGKGFRHARPTVCAGYTTNLPEVRESSQAHAHWKHGSLVAFCGGETPSEDLMSSVLILESEYGAVELWRVTPIQDGGGAP